LALAPWAYLSYELPAPTGNPSGLGFADVSLPSLQMGIYAGVSSAIAPATKLAGLSSQPPHASTASATEPADGAAQEPCEFTLTAPSKRRQSKSGLTRLSFEARAGVIQAGTATRSIFATFFKRGTASGDPLTAYQLAGQLARYPLLAYLESPEHKFAMLFPDGFPASPKA